MALEPDELAARVPEVADAGVLAAMYAAALEAIDVYLGAEGAVTELLDAGAGDLIMLSRPATSITTLKEHDRDLDEDDYELRPSGTILRRLHTGTNPARRWRGRIDVVYEPFADESERDRVAVELIKLEVNSSPGASSERIGEWSESVGGTVGGGKSYSQLRADILASFAPGFVMA